MDVLKVSLPHSRGGPFVVAMVALAATLVTSPWLVASAGADPVPEVVVKAAFLYNFVRFAEWPSLSAGAPIAACIVGDADIADALVDTVRGQTISGHVIDVSRPRDGVNWRSCQLLFVGDGETRRAAAGLDGIKALPVLTVSDGTGFSAGGGIIEIYVDGGRMRFAINVDAADHSGLHLSARLLGLATGLSMNKVYSVAAEASRRASLLVACIRPVCALLAPCRAGASTPTLHTLFIDRP
ncbi:MAG: YfiR family protein [Acidobacteriota bacterium]